MTEQFSDPGVATKLDRWERERRQFLWVGGMLLLVSVVLLGRASGITGRSKKIEAESLILRDASGRVRAYLGLSEDGSPRLALMDSEGRHQFVLQGTIDHSTTLSIYDRGDLRMNMAATSDGSAVLNFVDTKHQSSSGLYLRPDSTAGLALRSGPKTVHAAVSPDGHAGVNVEGAGDKGLARLGDLPRDTWDRAARGDGDARSYATIPPTPEPAPAAAGVRLPQRVIQPMIAN